MLHLCPPAPPAFPKKDVLFSSKEHADSKDHARHCTSAMSSRTGDSRAFHKAGCFPIPDVR